MVNDKLFKHPTVTKVIFQITFPNLFFLETKIPDLQLEIMKDFPESNLIVKQPIIFVKGNDPDKSNDENLFTEKIWEFRNPLGYVLGITAKSMSLSSTLHKTYDNKQSDNKFKDKIRFCIDAFGRQVKLPFVNRIGLRYSDSCPLFSKTSIDYQKSYNSSLSQSKFPIDNVDEFSTRVVKNVDDCKLIYQEIYKSSNDSQHIIFDFDASKLNVPYDNILETTDRLHEIVSDEYFNTINAPILEYMERDE